MQIELTKFFTNDLKEVLFYLARPDFLTRLNLFLGTMDCQFKFDDMNNPYFKENMKLVSQWFNFNNDFISDNDLLTYLNKYIITHI